MTEFLIIISVILLAPLVFSRMGFLVGVTAVAATGGVLRSIFTSKVFIIACAIGFGLLMKAVMS